MVFKNMGSQTQSDRHADTGYGVKDTPPEINRMIFERVMSLQPGERLEMGFSMLATAKELILAGLPSGLSDTDRKTRLYERLYGEPLPAGYRFTAP